MTVYKKPIQWQQVLLWNSIMLPLIGFLLLYLPAELPFLQKNPITYKLPLSIILILFLIIGNLTYMASREIRIVLLKLVFPRKFKNFDLDIIEYHQVHWLASKDKGKYLPNPTPLCPRHNHPLISNNGDPPVAICWKCDFHTDLASLKKSIKAISFEINNNRYAEFKPVIRNIREITLNSKIT